MPTSRRSVAVVDMVNWLSHVMEPPTTASFEMVIVVPSSHGVLDAVYLGARPGRGHIQSLFFPAWVMLVPPGTVLSWVGGSCTSTVEDSPPAPPEVPEPEVVESEPPQAAVRTSKEARAARSLMGACSFA